MFRFPAEEKPPIWQRGKRRLTKVSDCIDFVQTPAEFFVFLPKRENPPACDREDA